MKSLFRQAGDPDYLKVVLLQQILKLQEFNVKEGDQLVLVLDDGTKIISANKICQLLSMESCPKDFASDRDTMKWLQWEEKELKPSIHPSLTSPDDLAKALQASLAHLESHMTTCGGQYLLREKLSLADVVVWTSLYGLLSPEATTSQKITKEFPLVCRWFTSLAESNHFKSAVASMNTGQSSAPAAQDVVSAMVDDIPVDEMEAAKQCWTEGRKNAPLPVNREHPILPVSGERNILITSALPYVNNVPHLGNIIGCVLSGDVFARYCRLRNYRTLYICGTDEYGTATETKAIEEGLTPQEICQKYYTIHASIYKWFNIQFDHFGRTSTQQQTEIAQDIFWRCHDHGFIRKDTVDQLRCDHCNMFLADRFVEGTCPLCSYEDARGDQCDQCGKLINATELKSPRCKVCSKQPIMKTSNHLFLDLSKLESSVKSWFQQSSGEGLWTANAVHITSSWLRDGLKPRCISRDLKWGTPVPLEGYTDKVFYVWFDAPIGYLSITACYTKEWEKWWKNPDQVHLYQFMAKDNVPFHTVVFPCSLIGAEDNYTLLNHISSTEYLNYEDGKFSKSRGVGVFGNDAKDTGIPADVFRFYLLYVRPETQDSVFSWVDFVLKNNTELLNNLGNFINRVLSFTKSNFDSTVQEVTLTEKDVEFIAKINREISSYLDCMERVKIRDGLRHILSISRLGNIYFQANKPWVLVKGSQEERARAGSVLNMAANVVCTLSVLVQPYMPNVSKLIQEQLQAPEECNVLTGAFVPFISPGHKIGTPVPLFDKIDEISALKLKEKFSGKQAEIPRGKSNAASTPQESITKETTDVQEKSPLAK